MEDTPEVYHYSITEAAELLGCKEAHVLQFAAFNDLPLHVFVTDTVVDNDGNWQGSFSNYFRLNSMHIRTLIANGSTKLDPILLMEATPVQSFLGINYADHALGRVPLESGSWTYDRFPQTKEITLDANRVVILAKDLTEFQNKNASKERAISTRPSIEKGPIAARQTVSIEAEYQQKPLVNWKMRIQAEATNMWRRGRSQGANPTKNSIKDDLAKWCRAPENNIKTPAGINPSGAYIYRHVLRDWTPPSD